MKYAEYHQIMKNNLKSNMDLEFTKELVGIYFTVFGKPGHETNVSVLKSIINDFAREEWGPHTAVYFNEDYVLIENFDGRMERIGRT